MRVIGYVRVSTDEQAREGISLAMQETKLRAYCEAHDHELVAVVSEVESAKSLHRSGLTRALGALSAGLADGLLIFKLDRLTRSVVDLGVILEIFTANDTALLSVRDSLNTTTAAGRLVMHVMVSVSQWEREAISERTKDALHAKRERGERLGRPPVGWKVEDGVLVPSDRHWIVERVHRLRAVGASTDEIAANLNINYVPTGSGRGKWHRGTVHRYLNAPLTSEEANGTAYARGRTAPPVHRNRAAA